MPEPEATGTDRAPTPGDAASPGVTPGSPSPSGGLTPRSIAIWVGVALVGAIGWGVLALSRGEEISAAWLLAAALGSYAIGYRFYSRFIAHRVLKLDKTRATPAERLDNGVDFHPTDRRVLFGHHFAAVSRRGPAGRPGARRADGLPAGHHLDRRGRHLRPAPSRTW